MDAKTKEMKLEFIKTKRTGTTDIYLVNHRGQRMGIIRWDGGLFQYVFCNNKKCCLGENLLIEIASFISKLMESRNGKKGTDGDKQGL